MSEEPRQAPSLLRRFVPRAVLLIGLGIAASLLLPSLPKEQVLVFRVGTAAPLRKLAVSYTLEGEREPRSGATLRYDRSPPASVRHTVSLPDGRWVVKVDVERTGADGGPRETSYERRVNLGGGETTLVLEDTP